MMDPQSPIGQAPFIRPDLLLDNQDSLHESESSLFSRVLSSAEGCLEDFINCLPEPVPAIKYLWVPVAVVVGVVAEINLTFLALSVLGLLALQLICVHLLGSSPSTTDSPETDSPGLGTLPHPHTSLDSSATSASEGAETAEAPQPPEPSLRPQANLLTAVKDGDEARVRELIQQGTTDLNQLSRSGWTALTGAVSRGHARIVSLLLEAGVNVDQRASTAQNTALMIASHKGNIDIVRILLQKGGQINLTNQHGQTALIVAASSGHTEIVRLLGSHSERNLNHKTERGNTALSIARQKGHIETVQALIELGATDGRAEAAALGSAES